MYVSSLSLFKIKQIAITEWRKNQQKGDSVSVFIMKILALHHK